MRGHVTLRAFELPEQIEHVEHGYAEEEADHALSRVFDKALVGFDIEWRPNFNARQNNPTALVQIASLDAVVLVHVHHMADPHNNILGYVPQGLQQLLKATDVIKLGIGIRQDFEKLEDHYPYVTPQNYVDLAVVAAAYGMSEGWLEAMCGAFGHQLQKSKNISMSNWENQVLSGAQIHYAAQDAWASCWLLFRLFHRFRRGEYMPWYQAAPVPAQKLLKWITPFVDVATFEELVEVVIEQPQLFDAEVHHWIQRWRVEQAERAERQRVKRQEKRRRYRNNRQYR